MLTIALSKGRILDDTLPLLAEAGIVPTENPDKSRKLIIPTTLDDVRLLIVRATDVPTYVEHGAADQHEGGVHGQPADHPVAELCMQRDGGGLFHRVLRAHLAPVARDEGGRGRQLPRACGDEERLSRYPRQL